MNISLLRTREKKTLFTQKKSWLRPDCHHITDGAVGDHHDWHTQPVGCVTS